MIFGFIPILGQVGCVLFPLFGLLVLVIHVLCIVKGVGGERFTIPVLSDYADKF